MFDNRRIDIYFRLFSVAKPKDMDSGEIVVSCIQTGMKREFAMMMKAQSEIGGLPAGGRRMTRSQSTAGSSKGYVRSADKVSRKVKGSNVGDDLGGLEADLVVVGIESTVPQFRGTDGDSTHEDERPVGETTDLRMKMSKKVELSRIPTKLKDLLQTGLLEGLPVRYIHGSKLSVYGEYYRSPLAGPSAPASSSHPPVVSESAQISSDGQPQTKRQGMLTRKDLRMHKSVLAEDVLPEGTALSKSLRITRKMAVSPSQFEAHAGFASHRKPYVSIYTSNAVSLHQLFLELPKSRRSSTEENGDLCSICEDGGDLYAVKTVHEAFTPEKFAEPDANALAAGRVHGVDPLEAITQPCTRVVGTMCHLQVLYLLYFFLSGSAFGNSIEICFFRHHDFCKSRFSARTIVICDQCEKEYHVGCLKEQNC
ncbi:UNVERIFIED_CONTAM: hypothetical protein Scaly_2216900 [Sesamum calycinum]|uniref:Zinc finger PHD-type domain-containing protein n=1 Tax=Sesamum calycinum TaxID=2727403 RepID=A0AAW2M9Z4_9LAMI